jgi:hypothetical protein
VADARGGEGLGIQRAAEERQGRVGVGWNVAGRGGRCVESGSLGSRCVGSRQWGAEERGERGRMKKQAEFTNWVLMFLGQADEHKKAE